MLIRISLRFNRKILALASLVLVMGSCKQVIHHSDMTSFIAQNCAQHPINFYFHERAQGTQVYLYGKRDAEFRAFLAKLEQSYRTYGRDISGPEKIQVVGDFLPNYIDTCQRFFEPSIAECSHLDRRSSSFQQCISRFNRAYEEALTTVMKKSGRDPINLDQISLTHQSRTSESDQLH